MKNIIVWILRCAGFIALLGIFSGCARLSDKELDAPYLREPIFIDAKNRQGCKIAHFFNQDDDEKPLETKVAMALNAGKSWDGECKDGYANGMGAEIVESEDGIKSVLIAIYTERIPRYVYFYQSNGNEYALFMGAFGNIFHYLESDNTNGLLVRNDGIANPRGYRELQLRIRTSLPDIVFDTTYSNNRQLMVSGYELRDILLMPQKDEHKYVLRLMRDHKKDFLKSIANYGESLVIAQQYKNKVCGKSSGESSVDSTNRSADLGIYSANRNADSSADFGAIHHREICALKINYNAKVEIMRKLIEFLGEL